jgi:hypothetical protein
VKTILTLDKANQPFGFPQLNGSGNFNNIIVDGGVSATTISATTYQNLPTDVFVTGGTFSGGVITFTNNSGGTFNVSGISSFDTFVTGGTYSNGTTIFTNNTGGTFNVSGYFTGYTNVVNSLTTGLGLSGDVTTGDVTIVNTAPDQIVTLSGGTNISVSGTYPNFNIEFTGSTTSSFDYGKSYVIANNYQWF